MKGNAAKQPGRRPGRRPPRVRFGPRPSKTPLIRKSLWRWLPQWVALYAERGRRHRCWEGHRLRPERKDGRVHRPCVWCGEAPPAGASVLACRQCRWTVCEGCRCRPRLPELRDDPLFHGPSQPLLLPGRFNDAVSESNGTVIIVPGGNYEFLVPAEGAPAADLLGRGGFRTFVLRYRLLPKYKLTDMLSDLSEAVQLVRRTYGGPVAALGFSAGGHLTASLSLRTVRQRGCKPVVTRPLDAQVLVYPCIDASDWADPENCGFNNWEECYPAAKRQMLRGRDALIGGDGFAAPPTFLVASTADEASPPKEHTDPYARALRRHGTPCVYLRRDFGAHGFALTGGWTGRCMAWLRSQGFGGSPPAAA